jgi:hypothetical protein
MRNVRWVIVSALLFAAGAFCFAAGDVVVLQGGVRVDLQKPFTRQGNLVLLTSTDGTLLSVRASDIDWKATAAAKAARGPAKPSSAVTVPPETLAQAAKTGRDGPKARVKLTDADVSHTGDEEPDSEDKPKKEEPKSATGKLEVVDYSQEKSGPNLVVRGSMRNSGAVPAVNARMTVTALDEKGERIASGDASLSNGLVASGATVAFTATIPVGEKTASTLRFAPQWISPAPPAPAPAAGKTGAAAGPAGSASPAGSGSQAPPTPVPTPYGLGNLYAAPAPSAPTTAPADGKTGYIPGMSSPENQPKVPNQP